MVDVTNCLLSEVRLLLCRLKWDHGKCPLNGIMGCPLLRGIECIEVYGDTIWIFRMFVTSHVSTVEGCLSSGVPLYMYCHFTCNEK